MLRGKKAMATKKTSSFKNWDLWASRGVLALGVGLILSGIICFVAFNWQYLQPFHKFISLEAALLACLGTAYFYGFHNLVGQLLLTAASVLLGAFLACFGQIYQTGADSYTLFLMWSALMLPWVLFSAFAPLWLLWIGVSNLSFILYWSQDHGFLFEENPLLSFLIVFNGLILGMREYYLPLWAKAPWTRLVMVLPILACAFAASLRFIVDARDFFIPNKTVPLTMELCISTALSFATLLVFYIVYKNKRPDRTAFTATLITCALIFWNAMQRLGDLMALSPGVRGGVAGGTLVVLVGWVRRLTHKAGDA